MNRKFFLELFSSVGLSYFWSSPLWRDSCCSSLARLVLGRCPEKGNFSTIVTSSFFFISNGCLKNYETSVLVWMMLFGIWMLMTSFVVHLFLIDVSFNTILEWLWCGVYRSFLYSNLFVLLCLISSISINVACVFFYFNRVHFWPWLQFKFPVISFRLYPVSMFLGGIFVWFQIIWWVLAYLSLL